jgi:FkbM family methyltransferase
MTEKLKKTVKAILNGLGYEVKKTQPGVIGHSFPSDPFEVQRQIIKELRKPSVTILDVGAFKGITVEAYRAKFPNAEIYCFEPFPDSVAVLRKKFANDDKVHIVPKAVAEESGRRAFYANEFDATNSLLPRPAFDRRYYPQKAGPKDVMEVEVTALDGFATVNGVSEIDILKLDIQGGELMGLHGAKALLQTGCISLIYTEIAFIPHYEGAPLFHEIWSFLVDFGYSLFDIFDIHRATNGQIRYGNALFVGESVRSNVIDKYPAEP